jgi:hypothetical protein
MAHEEMARYGIHEQSPGKLAEEVGEYIITGGYDITGGHDDRHSHHKRVPSGIHDQYVRLLESITGELDKPGGPELPGVVDLGVLRLGKVELRRVTVELAAEPPRPAYLARARNMQKMPMGAASHDRARAVPMSVIAHSVTAWYVRAIRERISGR